MKNLTISEIKKINKINTNTMKMGFGYMIQEILDVNNTQIVYNKNTLKKTKLALANLKNGGIGIININCIGDSTCEGTSSDASSNTIAERDKGWVNRLRSDLQSKYGNAGEGFIANSYPAAATITRWAYTGTWNTFGMSGWNGNSWGKKVAITAGNTATITLNGTGVVVLFEATTDNPVTVTVTVDGGTESVIVYPINQTIVPYVKSGLSSGPHTVVVTYVSGTGKLSLLGAYETNTNSGVRVNKLGAAGSQISTYSSDFNLKVCVDYWIPKLVIINSMANDFNNQMPLKDYIKNWQTIISRIKAQGSEIIITTLSEYHDSVKPIPISYYKNALKILALQNNCCFIDVGNRWGTQTEVIANQYIKDGVHPVYACHRDFADVIYNLLTQ